MPTFTNTPQQGFTKPQFPRKPKPGENIHPDSRLAKDNDKNQKWQGPHPFLQAHGFNGDIDSFNRRTKMAHDGFTNAYGREPSPGVVWDIAKSNQLLDSQIPSMFQVPFDKRQVGPAAHHLESQHNGEAFMDRGDGKAQRTNLLTAFEAKLGHNHPDLQSSNPAQQVLGNKEFMKRYPMLAMGVVPMGMPFGSKFWQDAATSTTNPAKFSQMLGKLTPKQAETVALQSQNYQISSQAQGAAMLANATGNPASAGQQDVGVLQRGATETLNQAKQRITAVQKYLLAHDPGGLYAGLKPSGIMDRNWMVAYSKWNRTPGAAYLMMQTVASQNYFAPTAGGIKAMAEAAKYKDELANDPKNYDLKWQIEAMPLRFFADHYSPMGTENPKTPHEGRLWYTDARGVPHLNTQEWSHMFTDFWKYENTGTSWLPPVAAVQGLFRFAKLGYNLFGGGFNQLTADANGVTTVMGKGIPAIMNGASTKQIADMYATAIKENPDLVRVLGFGYLPKKLGHTAAFYDGVGNFILGTALALMMKGPGYWKIGEDVPLTRIRLNPAVRMLTKLAHSNIRLGDLWEAERVLGPGASRDFIVAMEKDIKSGKIDSETFHNYATRYFKEGKITYGKRTFDTPILGQLHDSSIPKSLARLAAKNARVKLRGPLNNLEVQALANGGRFGRSIEAMSRVLRGMFGLASPDGKTINIARDTMTPGKIQSFILNHGLMPRDQAIEMSNRFIRASAHNQVNRMESVLKSISDAYDLKFPPEKIGQPRADFERLLETEGLTYYRFPAGGRRRGLRLAPEATKGDISEVANIAADLAGVTGSATADQLEALRREVFMFKRGARVTDAILNTEDSIISWFNKMGHYWRSQILATGPGLFYKHLVRDSAAALMGGMKFRSTAEMDRAWQVALQVMKDNPEARRAYAIAMGDVANADTLYMLGYKYADAQSSFKLMDKIGERPDIKQELAMEAAASMRRQVMSKMYPAYLEARKTGDMTPIINKVFTFNDDGKLVVQDRSLWHMFNREMNVAKQIKDARLEYKHVGATITKGVGHYARDYQFQEADIKVLIQMRKNEIYRTLSQQYAKKVFDRYQDVYTLGKDHQIPDVWAEFDKMLWDRPGRADRTISKFLLDHEMNVKVSGGVPLSRVNAYDRTTHALISAYMSPNRFMRARLFDHKFKQVYAEMMKFGYDPAGAMDSALQIASHSTMYHMLDFSNTLQFEQRFRGFLPFFTKHRLFSKWLVSRMIQYPFLAVPISDVGKHLDPYGRVNFTFMGVPMNVNIQRLFWLNSADLPATIPGFEFFKNWIPGVASTGLAPEVTRFDSLLGAWIHAGINGWNYNSITAHMNSYDVARLDRYMAVFAIHWRMHHGPHNPPPESEALKYAMMRGGFFGITGSLLVNNSFMSPATFNEPNLPSHITKLDNEYTKLFNENPAKARDFLDTHPEVGLGWGVSNNFDVYNHVNTMWGLYDELHSTYLKTEDKYTKMALAGTPLTPEDYKKMHDAQIKYDHGIQALLRQDARSWTITAGGYKPGQLSPDGSEITNYGPWGTLFLHDPIGSLNKLIGEFKLTHEEVKQVYGYETPLLQTIIDNAQKVGLDPKSLGPLYDKLHRLEGVYKVASQPTLLTTYTKAESSFSNKLYGKNGLYAKAKAAEGYQKAQYEYQARQLILESYLHPFVKLDGKEVRVLPFAEYAYSKKTPAELENYIFKSILGFSFSGATYDQKQLIGYKTTPIVDDGWGIFNGWVADYYQRYGKYPSTSTRQALAAAVNKTNPGFWADYQRSHLPKSYILLYYAKKAFVGQYADQWRELVTRAAQTYAKNKNAWSGEVVQLDAWIRANWPPGFVQQYDAAGGATFLSTLNNPWG